MKRFLLFIFVCAVIVYALFSWYRIVTTSAPDFSVYYEAPRYLLERKPLYGAAVGFTGFGYPPQTALALLPLILFPFSVAQTLWVTGLFFCVPMVVWLSLKLITHSVRFNQFLVWTAIIFLAFPTKFSIGMGQISLYSLVVFLLGLLMIQKDKRLLGGVILGFSLVIKPQLALMMIPLVLVGKWRETFIAGLVVAASALIVLSLWGREQFVLYQQIELPMLLPFTGRDIYYNQSLSAFFSRVFALPIAQVVTQYMSFGLLVGSSLLVLWKRLPAGRAGMKLVAAVCFFWPVVILILPLSWQHHGVYLIPSFIYLWTVLKSKTSLSVLVISAVLISINIPDPQPLYGSLLLRATVLSHMFWGMVMVFLLGLRYIARSKG